MSIPLPDITQAHLKWKRSGDEMLKLYQNCRFLQPIPGETPENKSLAKLRIACMKSLSPIIGAPFEGAKSSEYPLGRYFEHSLFDLPGVRLRRPVLWSRS